MSQSDAKDEDDEIDIESLPESAKFVTTGQQNEEDESEVEEG